MPTSPAQQPGPAPSALTATGHRRRCGPVPALLLALAAPAIGAAGPAPEYGPEAEARFLERCAVGDATAPAATPCRRLMERLQAELGYPGFLEAAAGGPEAFGRAIDGRLAAASPAVRGPALR
jgi:hypothetical protein